MSQDHSLNPRQTSTNSTQITNPSSTNQPSPPGFENLHHLLGGRGSNIWSSDIANTPSDSHASLLQQQSVHPIQQHQQHFEFLQSDTNHYQDEQFNLEQSLASLTPTQEQCLLQMLQHQLLSQQEPHSYDRSINNHLDCDMFSSHANVSNSSLSQQQLTTNLLNQSSHAANILGSNSAVGLSNLRSSVNQDLYGGGGGFSTSVSSADCISNSLHRSSSDLGTRINSFYMDLGDLTTRNRNAALNEAVPSLCTPNQYLGQCLSNTSSLLSNTAANSLLGCHLENSSKVSMSSVPMPLDTRPLDNTKMLIAGKRIPGIGLDESQRAPGTPLSQTPPLKPLAAGSSTSQKNGSLNNQIQQSKNVDSRGISSVSNNDNTGRSKRNKKYKQAFEQSTTQLKPNPDPLVSLHDLSTPCAPVAEFSTCATEQNILFEKMGSLSSSFVNWLSSDKSPNKPCESQNLENSSNMVFNSIFGAVNGTSNTTKKSPIGRSRSDTTSATTSTTKASVPSKLSYSDVLSKQTSEKSATSCGQSHSASENGSGLSKSRYSDGRMSNSSNLSNNQSGNSRTTAKRLQGNAGRSSPLTSIRSSSKPNLAFGTRVGLDEFNYPTLEELASIYQCSNNFSPFSTDASMSNTQNSNHISESGTAQGCRDSLSMMSSCSNKKSKTATVTANNVLNNNNSKLASQKPSLKKSSFINNLSDAGGSGNNSSAEGSSADFSSVSAPTAAPSNIASQHQQQLLYGCAGSSSPSTTVSESNTDVEDISGSEKDTAEGSQMPQSTPLHTKSSNKSYGAGSGSSNNNNSSSRYRGSAVSNNNRVSSRSSKNSTTNNSGSRKRKDVDSAAVLQAQLQVLLQLCLTSLLAATRWLYHLVLEVAEMSSSLLVRCWERVLHVSITGLRVVWRRGSTAGRALADRVWEKVSKFWRPKGAKKRFLRSEAQYLDQHIAMPVTGEEAMKRLLACRGLDSYSILGVSPDASQEDIRRYYRRQAFLVHPDKNKTPGAEEAFKVLGHAFEEVGEPAKREEYDKRVLGECQLGEAWDKLSDLLKDLERKLEEAANMIRCTSCNDKHRRTKVPDRPVYAARYCEQCKIRHGAKDGDIWAESSYYGFWWQYFACMDGAVYNISEWAACQAGNLRQLRANSHIVQYRIITGGKKKPSGGGGGREHRGGGQQQQHLPSDPEIEEFFNQLYRDKFPQNYASSGTSSSPSSQHPGGDGAAPPTAPPNAGKRRGDRGGRRSRR